MNIAPSMRVGYMDKDKITEFANKITGEIIQVRIQIKNEIFFPLSSMKEIPNDIL